jgi:hypothetical protein
MADNDPNVTPAAAPSPEAAPAATPGLLARFFGVITSPRATYDAVARNPKWLGMAVLVLLVTLVPTTVFQSTAVGRQAALDQAVRATEAFGVTVTDQMYDQMAKSTLDPPLWRTALGLVAGFVFLPAVWAAIAGLLYGLMTVMGGNARFKQVYAILVHSSVISAIGTLFATPIMYLRESSTGVTNLAVFFPMLKEGSFLARLFGMVDLFMVWWVLSLSIGLAVLYRRKTTGVAIVLFSIYAVIALAIAAIFGLRSAS